MEWFTDAPTGGFVGFVFLALSIPAGILWLGRKKLLVAIPIASLFLLYAAVAIPSFVPPRPSSLRNACIVNLKMIQGAKLEWANDHGKTAADVPEESDLCGTNNAPLRWWPACPGGGVYTIGAVGESPTCSLAAKKHLLE